jgi:hypothetical protein
METSLGSAACGLCGCQASAPADESTLDFAKWRRLFFRCDHHVQAAKLTSSSGPRGLPKEKAALTDATDANAVPPSQHGAYNHDQPRCLRTSSVASSSRQTLSRSGKSAWASFHMTGAAMRL